MILALLGFVVSFVAGQVGSQDGHVSYPSGGVYIFLVADEPMLMIRGVPPRPDANIL